MMYERTIKLEIESKIDDIDLLSRAVRAICSSVVSEEVLLYNIQLGFVEAVSNVINHAYHRRPGHIIEVIVSIDDSHVTFQILDSGDKSVLPAPKKELDHNPDELGSLPESGMGLFLIHRVMDNVSISEKDGKNVLTLTKYFNPQT